MRAYDSNYAEDSYSSPTFHTCIKTNKLWFIGTESTKTIHFFPLCSRLELMTTITFGIA